MKTVAEVFEFLADKYGPNFTVAQFHKHKPNRQDWPSYDILVKEGGSWNETKKLYGYKPNMDGYSREYLAKCCSWVAEKYGPKFTIQNFNDYRQQTGKDMPSAHYIAYNYGWNNFKRELGYETIDCGPNTDAEKLMFCNDCLDKEDCSISIEECEYWQEYKGG